MALLVALATAKSKEMTGDDWDLVGRALADLQSRGFDLAEIKDTLRRLRRRLRDPGDERGEPRESSLGANAPDDSSPVF
ncbi:hypothetical protein [Bradyrhizobium sp. AZCC 1678]|uniref:hypothetical protein n=1 Tax=Bradyrhizobium sp. AZCC 1678 TaxID=3117030 RepID=UPI002FEF0925